MSKLHHLPPLAPPIEQGAKQSVDWGRIVLLALAFVILPYLALIAFAYFFSVRILSAILGV